MNQNTPQRTRICHLSTVHSWNDIRIFQKQCCSLVKEGYEVHLITQVNSSANNTHGVVLHKLRKPKNRIDRIFKLTNEAFEIAMKINAKLYQIHDPELLPLALKLKKSGKTVIYDAHENTPAGIKDKDWIPLKFIRVLVSNIFSRYELRAVAKLDAVISVAEPLLLRFKNRHKVLVRNLPLLEKFEGYSLPQEMTDSEQGLVYAGGLTEIRNIKEMISAVALLRNRTVLHLFGEWQSTAYKESCEQSPGWDRVKYWGFRLNEEVYAFLKSKGSLGLVLFNKNIENHKIALPNKAFEYMAAGIPILMSDIPYWKENFQGVAHFVDPSDPVLIAHAIELIREDTKLRNEMIARGGEVIRTMTWQADFEKLNSLYKELLSS